MGRTTKKLEERQESEGHACQQQGQSDDAGQALLFNSCVREQHFTHMLDRKIV